MIVQYDGIAFQVEQLLEFLQTPVFSDDGTTYLYTHFRLRVRAVWNPAATHALDDDGITPLRAAASIETLRHRLSQPRKVLKVRIPQGGSGGTVNVLLTSPLLDSNGSRYACDDKNGPCPIGMPVIQITGEKTAMVDWCCETWLNECPVATRPLLAHRWEMHHDVDQDWYTTRTVQGVATFRASVLERDGLTPDDWRGALLHVVPDGFKRERVNVRASSDGTTLEYTITDRQQPMLPFGSFAQFTRIEASYTEHKGIGKFSLSQVSSFGSSGASTGTGIGTAVGGPAGGLIGRAIGGFIGGAAGGVAAAAGMFPPMTLTLNARIWGSKTTTRQSIAAGLTRILALYRFGWDEAGNIGGVLNGLLSFFLVDKRITMDLWGKYGEVTATLRVPSEVIAALTVSPGILGGIAAGLLPPSIFQLPDDMTDGVTVLATTNGAITGGQAPPKDSGTRGDYINALVAAELFDACASSTNPYMTNNLPDENNPYVVAP